MRTVLVRGCLALEVCGKHFIAYHGLQYRIVTVDLEENLSAIKRRIMNEGLGSKAATLYWELSEYLIVLQRAEAANRAQIVSLRIQPTRLSLEMYTQVIQCRQATGRQHDTTIFLDLQRKANDLLSGY